MPDADKTLTDTELVQIEGAYRCLCELSPNAIDRALTYLEDRLKEKENSRSSKPSD